MRLERPVQPRLGGEAQPRNVPSLPPVMGNVPREWLTPLLHDWSPPILHHSVSMHHLTPPTASTGSCAVPTIVDIASLIRLIKQSPPVTIQHRFPAVPTL